MNKYFTFLVIFTLSSCTSLPPFPHEQLDKNDYAINKQALLKHLEVLASELFQGRKVGTVGNGYAQEYIIEQLKAANIKPYHSNAFRHPFSFEQGFKTFQAANIVGYVPAKNPTEKTIVLSAHYDHIGGSGRQIYNGADDNASGVAALLSMSKLISKSPLDHNVVFLFTDAEEQGLKGAFHFIEHHKQFLAHYVFNLNLDMIAGSESTKTLHYISDDLIKVIDRNSLIAFKQRHNKQLIKIKRGFKRAAGSNKTQSRRSWQTASDHGAFYKKNIPFIYYGVGVHKNYHTKHDDYKRANKDLFWHSTNIIYHQLLFLEQHLR